MLGMSGWIINLYPFKLPVHMQFKLCWLEVAVFKNFKFLFKL